MSGTPVYTQSAFRVRNDDGNESTATWKAALDTNADGELDVNIRLRIGFAVSVANSGNQAYALMYSKNNGVYTRVTTTSQNARYNASPNVADDVQTSQQITSGLYTVGRFDSNDAMTAFGVNSGRSSEVEWCFQLRSADLAVGNTMDFRMYRLVSGTPTALDAYSVTPRITVVATTQQEHVTVALTGGGTIVVPVKKSVAKTVGVVGGGAVAIQEASARASEVIVVGGGLVSVEATAGTPQENLLVLTGGGGVEVSAASHRYAISD